MLFLCQRNLLSRCWKLQIYRDYSSSFKGNVKVVARKLSHFLESNSLLRWGLGTCDALFTVSHHLQVVLDRGMEGRFVQVDFSAAFDRVNHCGMLYKLISIGVGGQFLFIVSEFLSDRRQRVSLDGKVSASVNGISGLPQGSVLGTLLFILYTSELFRNVGSNIVGHADDTTINAVIPSPLLRPQVNK